MLQCEVHGGLRRSVRMLCLWTARRRPQRGSADLAVVATAGQVAGNNSLLSFSAGRPVECLRGRPLGAAATAMRCRLLCTDRMGAFRRVLAQQAIRVSLRPRCRGLAGSSTTPNTVSSGLTDSPAGPAPITATDMTTSSPCRECRCRGGERFYPRRGGSAPVAFDLGERDDTLAGRSAAHQPTVMTIWPRAGPLAMVARPSAAGSSGRTVVRYRRPKLLVQPKRGCFAHRRSHDRAAGQAGGVKRLLVWRRCGGDRAALAPASSGMSAAVYPKRLISAFTRSVWDARTCLATGPAV